MPAKMLVRALKVLNLFPSGTIGTGIDTAALNQPGDEGCAYGRAAPDWQRLTPNQHSIADHSPFAATKVIDDRFSQIDISCRPADCSPCRRRTGSRRIL